MKSRTMKFTLDCSKVGNQLCIDGIRQGDTNSIVFIISLANGINLLDIVAGKEESVVVTMYGKKPDGTTIVRDCGINEDGNITYTIHTQDTTCVGIVSYQLVVTSTREKILASPVFSTMVEERNLFKTYTVLTAQPDDWADGYDKYYYYENGRFYKLNRFERESAPEWIINKYYSVNDNEVESTSDFDALAYALLRAKQYSDRTEEYLAEVKKKADKSTTLAGYGITDALQNAKGTVSTNNLADNCVSSNKLSADVRANLNSKAESAKVNQQLSLKADVSSVYNKSESDALLKVKANSADVDASVKTINTTIANNQKSVNASLESLNTALTNKAEKSTVSQLSARMQTAETSLAGKANATDVANVLKAKEDNSNKVSSKTDITDSRVNYPSIEYLDAYYYKANELYSSEETDKLLGDKANANSVYSKAETDNSLGNKADKADVDDVKAYIGYTDDDIAGLCVDYENKTFKRLAGAVNLSQGADFNKFQMYGGRKRCNVSDDGTINAFYGDEGYTEDGSNGQVMVYQPAFYYRVVPLKLEKNADSGIGYHLRKANYYVSSKPKTGFKLHPAFYDENGNAINYILFSAYEGSMYDVSAAEYVNDGTNTDTAIEVGDLLCSVANVKPISGLKKILNKVNLETMAQNRNTNWHLETIKATSANQLLMIIELGTMNTQTAIGQGVVNIPDNKAYNCSSLTGSTAELGNATGQATETLNEIGGTQTAYTESRKVSVTYRGVENPWGNIRRHIQGINIWSDGSMGGGQPYVANDFTFNEAKHSDNYEPVGFTIANSSGWINSMGYGSEEYDWLFIPSETGGSVELPVGDYLYKTTKLNGYKIAVLGGAWYHGGIAGVFFLDCTNNVSTRNRNTGGRLLYVPTAKSGNTPTKSYTASEVDALLATKYDSANIESGTSTLTPHSNITDKIKSASCTYKTIGDVVIVSATVKMNVATIGANSTYPLIDLPYKCIAEDNVFCVGISNLGKVFKFVVLKNNTWLQFQTQDKTDYTFADGEQINAICLYKIK